jgi:cytochrome c oxidase cbb3-type subunit 3
MGALLVALVPLKLGLIGKPAEVWATDSAQREAAREESPVSGQRIPDSLEGNPEAIALGKRIFHTYCWGCHGRNGTGAQCPDFSDNNQIHGDRYEDLVKVVTNGVKGTPMGPWGYALGRERLLQVVAYVFSLKGTREARQK